MPAYNAEHHIKLVIERIPQTVWQDIQSIWIINDGSTDNTGKIINRLSNENKKIKPIHILENRGYGYAVKKGIELCKKDKCDIAVCLHSDGQYAPEDIPMFVEIMQKQKFDVLQGSRIASGTALSGNMPFYKYVANRVLTFMENKIFHLNMTDYHSGFLFFSKRALENIPFEYLSTSFDFDLESIACARTLSLKIGELPTPTRYADEISHLNPIAYGFRVLGVMAKYILGRYKRLCNVTDTYD